MHKEVKGLKEKREGKAQRDFETRLSPKQIKNIREGRIKVGIENKDRKEREKREKKK